MQGIAINTRREPLNDVRVRKALRHLFNRESLVEKLMFNEYVLTDSIFPGSVYQNPGNEQIRYDPAKALALLAESGWKDRDAQGHAALGRREEGRASHTLYTWHRGDILGSVIIVQDEHGVDQVVGR